MSNTSDLLARIDAEFAANTDRVKEFQAEAVQAYEGRQERLQLFEQVCEQFRDVWQPKLQTLAQKFDGQVKVSPHVAKGLREALFTFQSPLAAVKLRFSASTDTDVRKVVLDYNLEILPILMKFEPHAQTEFPLENIDPTAVSKWFDDRIVDFVRTYLSLSQNDYYLQDHMVVDPVAGVKFPKFTAAATLAKNGKKYYFISESTRNEFESSSAAPAAKGAAQ
jgi:YHS domain-containing protein